VEIIIGGRAFRTKKEALATIYEVRERTKVAGRALGGDDEFLRDLLALHPQAETKVGNGVDHFDVRRNINNDGFWIVRSDGSETDFSFMQCLYGTSQSAKVQSAMRYAVLDQKLAARDRAFGDAETLICPVTGEVIGRQGCHMDHDEPTFIEIADAFARSVGGYDKIETVSDDGGIGRRFVDEAIAERWRTFHRERARLRAVSIRANLSVLRRSVPRTQRP